MLLIKNGTVIDPKSGMEKEAHVLIDGEKIRLITEDLEHCEEIRKIDPNLIQEIDADGLIVAPGLVDVHSHFRDPGQTHKETIHTGAKAAAAGGYTSIVMMANTVPTVDTAETLDYIKEKTAKERIHIYPCATVSHGMEGKELVDMPALKEAGAVGFTDDGKPLVDEALLKEAFQRCAELQVPISLHEEDPKYVHQAGVNAGEVAKELGLEGAERKAEYTLVERDVALSKDSQVHLDIQHISAKETVDILRQALKEDEAAGIERHIHGEATPHHFSSTEDLVRRKGTLAKVNPPIRTEEDRQAIIKGLQDGTLDLIATDHAPHSTEEKNQDFTKAPSGMIGLETALPLAITNLVKPGHLTLMQVLEKMTINPAKLYGLDAGYLAEGGPADLVIFDPRVMRTIDRFASKSENSPYRGATLYGEVVFTIAKGEIVYVKSITQGKWSD